MLRGQWWPRDTDQRFEQRRSWLSIFLGNLGGDERFFYGKNFMNSPATTIADPIAERAPVSHCDLAIIGSGMAAMRLIETLRRRGDRRSIVLLGAELTLPYNRILLSPLLGGEIDWQQTISHP